MGRIARRGFFKTFGDHGAAYWLVEGAGPRLWMGPNSFHGDHVRVHLRLWRLALVALDRGAFGWISRHFGTVSRAGCRPLGSSDAGVVAA